MITRSRSRKQRAEMSATTRKARLQETIKELKGFLTHNDANKWEILKGLKFYEAQLKEVINEISVDKIKANNLRLAMKGKDHKQAENSVGKIAREGKA